MPSVFDASGKDMKLKALASALVLLSAMQMAQAAPILCGKGSPAADCVVAGGDSATDYWYGALNPSEGSVSAFINGNEQLGWGDGWAYVTKLENGSLASGLHEGVRFDLSVSPQQGTWSVSVHEMAGLSGVFDVIAVLKAGPQLGLWYLPELAQTGGTYGGQYAIPWTVGKGSTPALSHFGLLVRTSSAPPPPELPPVGQPPPGEPPAEVAEPGSLALFGAGLVALYALGRRRKPGHCCKGA